MATRFRLKSIEAKYGDLNKIIPPLVNLHGQAETGRLLGTSGATISNWLKANGYELKMCYVKRGEAQ